MKTLISAVIIWILAGGLCLAEVPQVLNHQGMLTDEMGTPLSGDHYMIFRLYEVAAGGTAKWSEARLVSVTDGIFNVYLGDVSPLDDSLFLGQDIWLGVTVEDDDEMTPRLRMGSVLYAFTANNSAAASDTWYEDADGDGYGNPDVSTTSFSQPPGYVSNGSDCDDTADYIHPDAEEFCDGLDYNCDGFDAIDLLGPPCPMQAGVCGGASQICGGELGWLPCDSESYGPYYEIDEITCDGRDNDCDGLVDEGLSCDDGNPCTADYCNEQGCTHSPLVGYACDDGDPCTVNDTCDGAGSCLGSQISCDDGIACTSDMCDGMGGCVHEVQPGLCLIAGQCYLAGDYNPLQECQICDPATSVINWTNAADGTLCSGGQCSNGVCIPD